MTLKLGTDSLSYSWWTMSGSGYLFSFDLYATAEDTAAPNGTFTITEGTTAPSEITEKDYWYYGTIVPGYYSESGYSTGTFVEAYNNGVATTSYVTGGYITIWTNSDGSRGISGALILEDGNSIYIYNSGLVF